MPSPKMSLREFCDIVSEAMDSIPAEFQSWLENVVVDVADEPNEDELRELEDRPDLSQEPEELVGLFIGTPVTEQEFNEHAWNTIKIFRKPIERVCETREEIIKEIRDTVLHELAHHFGYEEEDLEDFEASR